jgi:hypothetical protein
MKVKYLLIAKSILCWIAVLSLIVPVSASAAPYHVNPKGLWVPGQSAIGYYDQGQSVAVGKITPFKVVVMGGSLTAKQPNYRFKLLKVEGASTKDMRIDPKTGVVYGAGPSLTPGTKKVWARVDDAKGYYYKFWFPLDISQCNSAGSILDGTLVPCPEIAVDNYNINRVGYFQPGKKGVEYNLSLAMVGGIPPYTFTIADQTKLPKGLTLNSKLGLIKGTPTQSGSFTIRWRTTTSTGAFGTSEATIKINR